MAKQLNRVHTPIYLITDRTISGLSHVQIARLAIKSGIRTIQLREKHMSELYSEALAFSHFKA
jgi:thiamine monophosphate synthase